MTNSLSFTRSFYFYFYFSFIFLLLFLFLFICSLFGTWFEFTYLPVFTTTEDTKQEGQTDTEREKSK